jgi:branched-chain amino acid transport system permease protein
VFEWLDPLQRFTLDIALITTLLVVSVHLAFRAAIFSLATMGFAALGAYTTGVLVTKEGWGTWAGIAAGVLLASVVGALFAAPILRLRGIYLALGTLALAESIIVVISNVDLTNKTLGISGIPNDVTTDHLVAILVVVFVLLQLESRSHFGRAVKAVRLDEPTANGLGISVRWVRFSAFVASAALAGMAGALEAHRTTVISPEQFGVAAVILPFAYALVGGNDHWLGPVLTALAASALRHWLSFDDSNWDNILFGTLLVVVIMMAPGGLTDPTLRRRVRRLRRRLFSRRGAAVEEVPPPLESDLTPAPPKAEVDV